VTIRDESLSAIAVIIAAAPLLCLLLLALWCVMVRSIR